MSVTIRHAGPGDEPAVVDLVREMALAEGFPTSVDDHYVRHFLASPVCGVLLALDDGAPGGILSYTVVPGLFHAADSGLIQTLVVTAERRGEGIGTQLVETVVRLFRESGCAEASVSAGADNEAAQKLYCDAGLTEASVLLETHFDAGEPEP